MDLTSTLNLSLTELHPRLAAAVGLTEATARTLTDKALEPLVRALGQTNDLGSPEALLNTCQQLFLMRAHIDITVLTRADSGWPEHRRYLAQTLLGAGRFSALAEHYVPGAPDRAGEWLGCLTLVALATAGQYAADTQMAATEFHHWLSRHTSAEHLAFGLASPPVNASSGAAAVVAPGARPTTSTAPWWPLAALALVGIGTSSYFWRQQTAVPTAPAPQAKVAAVPARAAQPMTTLKGTPATTTAVVASGTPEAIPVGKPIGAAPAKTVLPVRVGAKLAPVAALKPAHAAKPKLPNLPLPVGAGKLRPALSRTAGVGSTGKELRRNGRADGQTTAKAAPNSPPKEGTNSTEGQLYKRLANPDVVDRKPIDLDRLSFAPGEAALDIEGAKQLGNIATLLKTFPHYRLIVFGNAEPTEPHSMTLALERANTVIAELVKQGVPSTALQAQGHLRPAADKADDPSAKRRPALYISSLD